MTSFLTHISNKPFRLFPLNEQSEALMMIYNVFKWMLRDEATMLLITPNTFVWFKQKKEVGRFTVGSLQPEPSFKELFKLILERDALVRASIKRYSLLGESVICEL